MRKSIILLILFVFSTASFAQFSQFKTNPYSNTIVISLASGISQSETDISNSNLGITGLAKAEYFFSSNSKIFFGLKLETGYSNLSGDQSNESILESFDTDVISFGPSVTLNYQLSELLFPYIALGTQNLWYYDFTSMNIVGEIGLRFLISNYFAVNGNVAFNFLNEDNLDRLQINGSSNDFYSTFSIGISYALDLTVTDDFDGDGIVNIEDGCPEQTEDFDGFEDNDGCPEFDNDKDGIVDINDECVNEAEDFDGFNDEDGCPDPDNDEDGILDSQDGCPDLREDFDSFEDNDGCPELDNDEDGIVDENDKCPNEPETFNRFEDYDGCPDELPITEIIEEPVPIIEKTESNPTYEKKIRSSIPNEFLFEGDELFISNTAKIKSSSSNNLDVIAEQMKSNPSFKWRIEDHLDNSGLPGELKALSTSRAKSIMNYLVAKGVSQKSFEVVGLANQFPLAPNSTIYGRLKNRRVVIKRIR